MKGYRMKKAVGHPIAPKSGCLPVSRLVLYEKIGPGPHLCHWCGEKVDWLAGGQFVPGALLADHVDFDISNDSPENLVPSCNHCNITRTRDGDRRRIMDGELSVIRDGKRTRAVERHCNFCGTEFLVARSVVAKGDGRFCSRSCAAKGRH